MSKKAYDLVTRVPAKAVLPYAKELVQRCGGCEKAAEYAGVGTGTMYRLVSYLEYVSLQKETAQRIFQALIRRRREDRRNGATSPQFARARMMHAILEERLERAAAA